MKINIEQGTIKVDDAIIITRHMNLVAIELSLLSKYAEAYGTFIYEATPAVSLGKNKSTLYMNDNYTQDTLVSFPEFENWRFFAVSVTGYTANVVLIKND